MDTLRIDGSVLQYVSTVTEGGVTRYVYAYNGLGFVLDVEVDAVQTHNAHDAMTSAWGRTN